MGFTIKCNKCGNEQVFTNESKRWEENIEIDVDMSHTFSGSTVNTVDIFCENINCNQYIELKY